ncbi:MAG: hypothetical protein Q7K42_06080 [Candidatus Diapherotrites archaeon]|nr:hypothetical protein [Candidatus Diapherotrites archaeon]
MSSVDDFENSTLVEFFGKECPHSQKMFSLVEKLERETGLKVLKLEVWHSQENQLLMSQYEDIFSEASGGQVGVPTFYNKATGEILCGEVDYSALKEWALKEPEELSYVV